MQRLARNPIMGGFGTLEQAMPLTDCEVRDPRIRRTRQFLQKALETLLQTRSFEEISVQEISEAATVNRATFYDHYEDKFSLLEAMVASGFHKLIQDREIEIDGTCPSAATALIRATCDYLAEIRVKHSACTDNGSGNPFEPLIDAAILKAITRVLAGPAPLQAAGGISDQLCARLADHPSRQLALETAAWAIYGSARQWSRDPDRPPVDIVVPQILGLVLPILSQGLSVRSPLPSATSYPA